MRPTINGVKLGFWRWKIGGALVQALAFASRYTHPALNPYLYECGFLHDPCRPDTENYGVFVTRVKHATRRLYEWTVNRRRGYFDE